MHIFSDDEIKQINELNKMANANQMIDIIRFMKSDACRALFKSIFIFFPKLGSIDPEIALNQSLSLFDDAMINEVEVVIKEHKSFLDDVEQKDMDLFTKEKDETTKEVFEKIDYDFSDPLFHGMQDIKIDKTIKTFDKIKDSGIDEINKMVSIINDGTNLINAMPVLIKDFDLNEAERVQNLIDNLRNKVEIHDRLQKDNEEKRRDWQKELDQNTTDINCISDSFIDAFKVSDVQYNLISNNIKKTDSYHLNLTKYICRLYHILTKGNRDYETNEKIFYHIKKTKAIRNKIEAFFKIGSEFSIRYPNLSKFCYDYLVTLPSVRNDAAHENPPIEKIQKSGKQIQYPRVGKTDGNIDIDEFSRILCKYTLFLNGIGLFNLKNNKLVKASLDLQQNVKQMLDLFTDATNTTKDLATKRSAYITDIIFLMIDKAIIEFGYKEGIKELFNFLKDEKINVTQGILDKILTICTEWNRNDEETIEPLICMAKIYCAKKDTENAMIFANKLRDMDEMNTNVWSIFGMIDFIKGDYEKSTTNFQKSLSLSDANEEAFLNLISSLKKRGLNEEIDKVKENLPSKSLPDNFSFDLIVFIRIF